MNYLIFNNGTIISDGNSINVLDRDADLRKTLGAIQEVRICCVDVDVMIASALQDQVEKKDSLLAQKFVSQYSDEYVTINERVGNNLFQVIGVKEEKVQEVYGLIPIVKVDAFIPYAIAIRTLLIALQMDMSRSLVFVDCLRHEKFITVFDGLKFSRTRTVNSKNAEDILNELKRSQMDFNKKLGEFASTKLAGEFVVFINDLDLVNDIVSLEPGFMVNFFDCQWPAIEGLKLYESKIKYRIHKEIILEKQMQERRSRLSVMLIALGICLGAFLFFGFNQMMYSLTTRELKQVNAMNLKLKQDIEDLDLQIYRDSLKRSKALNYSNVFFELAGLLPSTYEISSFKFADNEGSWIFDAYLSAQDDQFYDEIPRIKLLKNAQIKNFLIKNRPGKYLKVIL